MGMLPGKSGVHLRMANMDQAMEDIIGHITTVNNLHFGEGQTPENVLKILVEEAGWEATSDNFGRKAYTATVLPNGQEFRVTYVIRDGEAKLDLRSWYDPKAGEVNA